MSRKRKGPTPRRRPVPRGDHDARHVQVKCERCRRVQPNARKQSQFEHRCRCGSSYGVYA